MSVDTMRKESHVARKIRAVLAIAMKNIWGQREAQMKDFMSMCFENRTKSLTSLSFIFCYVQVVCNTLHENRKSIMLTCAWWITGAWRGQMRHMNRCRRFAFESAKKSRRSRVQLST